MTVRYGRDRWLVGTKTPWSTGILGIASLAAPPRVRGCRGLVPPEPAAARRAASGAAPRPVRPAGWIGGVWCCFRCGVVNERAAPGEPDGIGWDELASDRVNQSTTGRHDRRGARSRRGYVADGREERMSVPTHTGHTQHRTTSRQQQARDAPECAYPASAGHRGSTRPASVPPRRRSALWPGGRPDANWSMILRPRTATGAQGAPLRYRPPLGR